MHNNNNYTLSGVQCNSAHSQHRDHKCQSQTVFNNINLQQKQSIFYNQLKITVQLGKWLMESNWFFNNLAPPSLYYATCITQQLDPKPLVLFTFLGTHLCIKRYRRNRRVQSEHVIAEERLHTQSQAVHVPRHGSRGGKNCFFSDGPK